jgi:hypothetical protein
MRKEIFWGLWVLFFSVIAAASVVVYFAEKDAEQANEPEHLKFEPELVPGNIHFGPGLYNGPNDGWYQTDAGEWQRVEDGTDQGEPIPFTESWRFTASEKSIPGAFLGQPGQWTFTADEPEELSYTCALLQISTDGGGEICIEPDGSVRIEGVIPNRYGEFWRGVAREWTSFERTMCRERLIRQLNGDTIPWQEPDQ